ncbi:MAG: hypothetical protein ACREVJ_08400 [Gammaproteobacteria bacterium]
MDYTFEVYGMAFVADERRSASFPPAGRRRQSENAMIPERIKKRLKKDREMTTITLRVPVDVVETLKELAPKLGYSGYQPLIKAYVGEGLRRDEARLYFGPAQRLAEALKKKGVDAAIIEEALELVSRAA